MKPSTLVPIKTDAVIVDELYRNKLGASRIGEVFEIKTLIQHPMETGFRPDPTGKPIPRDIIRSLVCTYNGVEIFRAPPLARALYFTTEVDQPIPEALYHAVAQVIAYVFSLEGVQPGRGPMRRPSPCARPTPSPRWPPSAPRPWF